VVARGGLHGHDVTTRRLRTERLPGWLAVALGLGFALALQLASPVGVPLYDGVIVNEPYRYLQPSGGQPGDPSYFVGEEQVDGSETRMACRWWHLAARAASRSFCAPPRT
jgi:hypothetical protein